MNNAKLCNAKAFEEDRPVCTNCKKKCKRVEQTFNYAGTHCTNGNSGTYHTGHYISDCCLEEVEDSDESEIIEPEMIAGDPDKR